MRNLPIRKYNSSNGHSIESQQEFRSLSDPALKQNIEVIRQSQLRLNGLDDLVRKVLKLPSDRRRTVLAKIIQFVLPVSWYESLPDPIFNLVAEESDALFLIETLRRSNLDDVQLATKNLAESAIEKREMLNILMADISRARQENWSAQKLQLYIADRINETNPEFHLYDEVSQLLAAEFNAFSEKEKEDHKNELLADLQSMVEGGISLMELNVELCKVSLRIFARSMVEYYKFVHYIGPTIVMRNTAKSLVNLNHSMYASRDAIEVTIKNSVEAMGLVADGMSIADNYSLSAPNMKALFASGRASLAKRLKVLQAANRNIKPTSELEAHTPEVDAEALAPSEATSA